MQQDLTQGSITRHLLSMGAFMAVGMVFQTLYFLVDLYFVSRLGSAAIAGVSTAGTVFFLVMGATQLVAVGAMALIAQAIGAKDQTGANLLSNQALSLSLAFGLVTMTVVLLFGGTAVAGVGADAATDAAAQEYLGAFAPGLALMFPSAALGAGLRAAGVVGPPMILQTLGVIVNVILAPILIAGWLTGAPLGVAGAGWASTISAGVVCVGLFLLFPRVQTIMRLGLQQMRPRWESWGRIVAVGLPATAEFLLMFVNMGVVYWVIREVGPQAQAGFGIGSRIMQSIFLPVMAVAFAAGPIAGQNFGARNAVRVRETFKQAALISSALMLSMTAFAHWRGDLMLAPFTEDPAALAVAEDYLRIVSLSFVASGLVFTCSSMFQGLGDTRPSLLASASRLLTFVIPAIWLTGQPFFSLHNVWLISLTSVVAQMGICLLLLRTQFRRKLAGMEGEGGRSGEPSPPARGEWAG
ncbi:MAG TPA: MATE family efflux transporter [Hyphomonadaceae bacterium]|nr:MATE family efflux transporter [Hyphomonadaceae bacterium]